MCPLLPKEAAASTKRAAHDLRETGEQRARHLGTQDLAGELHAQLRFGRIEAIFQAGLHEFLTDVIERTAVLGSDISAFYLMS